VVNGILVTLLAVGVALVGRWVRRPALIHALWILVLVKAVTPPLVALHVSLPLPPEARSEAEREAARPQAEIVVVEGAGLASSSAAQQPATTRVADPATRFPSAGVTVREQFAAVAADSADRLSKLWRHNATWISWSLGTIWIAGTLIWCSCQLWLAWRFQRRIVLAAPAPARLVWEAERLAQSMGLVTIPRIVLVPDVVSPMLCSIGSRTRLVLPQALLESLNDEAGRTLLTHELAHYARGDHWVRLLELVATALFWWHPVVWWARRQIEVSEEECCDAWVVGEFPNGSRTYAEALLATIDFLAEAPIAFPPAATGVAQLPFLRHRLTQIMRGVAPKSLSVQGRLGVVLLALLLLPFHPTFSRAQPASAAGATRKPVISTSRIFQKRRLVEPRDTASDAGEDLGEPERRPSAGRRSRATEAWSNPLRELQLAQAQPVEAGGPWAIAVSRDGRFQITQRSKGHVVLYDADLDHTTDLGDSHILTVVFSPDGRIFASGGSDHLVRLWDSETGEALATFVDHVDVIPTLSFTPDGLSLISGCRDGEVRIRDVNRTDRVRALRLRQTPVESLSVSRDGRLLAVATDNRLGLEGGRVTIRDLTTLSERQSFPASSTIGAVAFHEDGISLVIGEANGRITFWNLLSGRPTAVGFVPKDVIASARFSVDTHALSRVDPNAVLPVAPAPGAAPELPPVIRGVFGELPLGGHDRQHEDPNLRRPGDDRTAPQRAHGG